MRKGLGFTDYGMVRRDVASMRSSSWSAGASLTASSLTLNPRCAQVDAAAVKAQRLGVDPAVPACPVTLQMLEEYEQYNKRFRAEVHANTGGLELPRRTSKQMAPMPASS